MCGISGFLNFNNNFSHNDLKKFSLSMSSTLERRGPDSFGIWVEKEKKLTLSHRRLSTYRSRKAIKYQWLSSIS